MVKKKVMPIFDLMKIKVTTLVSERAGHVLDHVQTINLDDYDG